MRRASLLIVLFTLVAVPVFTRAQAPQVAPTGAPPVAQDGAPTRPPDPAPSADVPAPPADVAPPSAPTPPPPGSGGQPLALALRVIASSGVGGHFAEPVCEGGVTLRPAPFARYASDLASTSPNGHEAFVIDTGGLVQPHGVARHALAQDPESLAALVEGLGYDALAFGYRDLESHRPSVLDVARALAAHGVPMVLSNLRCDPTASALCEMVQDAGDGPLIIDRGPERVAFLAFLDPAAIRRVSPANVRGLTIAPLLDAVRDQVRLARARGATIVIVSIDNGATGTAIADALSVAEALEDDAKPDLMLAARAGDDMLFTRPASFTPAVAAAPPEGVSTIDVRRELTTGRYDMLVYRPEGDDLASPALDAFVAQVGPSYCEHYEHALRGGHIDRPLDADALFSLATAAVREAAGSEIAILNRGVIDESFVTMRRSAITRSDVHVGLRYDEPIVVATVDADYLRALARALAGKNGVHMLGLTITNPGMADEAIAINGRPLEPRGRYRIATVAFIAEGGDGLAPTGPEYRELDVTLREALVAHLERPRSVDPRDDFADPASRLVFAFTIQSDASFGGTTVQNGSMYEASQLDRENNIIFGTQNTLTLTAQSSRFAWDSSFVARYRTTRISDGTREEGDDLVSFRSNARYRGLRSRLPKVYVPEPFAELYAESELTIPDTEARDYRHFLVRPTVGAQFTLAPPLGFRINAGFETQILSDDPMPAFGLGGQLLLTPWTFFTKGPRNGTVGGSIDYFVSDLGRGQANRQEIRANLDFGVTLSSFFGLAFTSTLFGLRERGQDLAVAFSTTASVRVGWYVRTQR